MLELTIEKKDLEAYFLLRVRILDFMHLTMLWQRANKGHDLLGEFPAHGRAQLMETLRTASLGWFASLIDPHNAAVNAFVIWPKIFPHMRAEIAEVEQLLEVHQNKLQGFRSSVAFHSSKSIRHYINSRAGIKTPEVIMAIGRFLALAQKLSEEEDKITGLPEALASMELYNR
jgi:hypothetical protein